MDHAGYHPEILVFEHVLVNDPNFDDLDQLTRKIEERLTTTSERILHGPSETDGEKA